MLKSIFIQLWNRKQSNIWIVLELLLVFCLIWYIVDYLFVLNYNYHIPDYRNTRHTWQINLSEYPPEQPEYRAEENEPEAKRANYARILQVIKNYPGVEAVSVSFFNSTPGSGGWRGGGYITPNDTITSVQCQMITIDPDQDFFRVFGYTSGQGKKPVSVQDFDWTNTHAIIISQSVADQLFPNSSAIGKEMATGRNSNVPPYIVAGIVDDTKRFDYERPQNTVYLPLRLGPDNLQRAEISIRIHSSIADSRFQETFKKEMANTLQTGNFYLKNLVSYDQIKENTKTLFGLTNEVRIRIWLMTFFLLNILLCVIGTFWYRVNTRREEIGLRKSIGSSKNAIRNNMLREGLCLLTVAFLPAMIIEYQFVRTGQMTTLVGKGWNMLGNYLPDRTFLRFLITNGITWIVMAVVVLSAIWLPARKAAEMAPADALHYE
jgi:ABC-type antimicrobial peptide transport system permease subunit